MMIYAMLLTFLLQAQVEEEIRPTIEFQAQLEVSQQRSLSILDLAKISGFESDDIEILADTSIKAKFVNGIAVISQKVISKLMRMVRSQLGYLPRTVIPSQIKVIVSGTQAAEPWLRRLLEEAVVQNCGECEFQILNLEFSKIPKLRVLSHVVQIRNFRGGSFHWPIQVSDGEKKHVISATGYLKLYRYGPVATKLLQAGDRVENQDFEMSRIDVTYKGKPLADPKRLNAAKLRSLIRSGDPIYSDDLAREKLIRRGQPVTVIFEKGSMNITAYAKSLSAGDRGDFIDIKTNKSGRVLSARVVDKGTVKVR